MAQVAASLRISSLVTRSEEVAHDLARAVAPDPVNTLAHRESRHALRDHKPFAMR
jgi:hypothetical protein